MGPLPLTHRVAEVAVPSVASVRRPHHEGGEDGGEQEEGGRGEEEAEEEEAGVEGKGRFPPVVAGG